MNLNRVFNDSWFVKLTLIMWLVSSVFIVVLLSQIDEIVHRRLYDFGLNFSYDWAVPYWAGLRLIYICLALPAFLTIAILVLGFWNYLRGSKVPEVKRQVEKETKRAKTPKVSEGAARGSVLIACSKCGKRFSKPILMLDFRESGGKLVNVCPFCGAKLGENNNVIKDGVEVRFGEEKVVRDEK